MEYKAFTRLSKTQMGNINSANSCEQFATPLLKKFGVKTALSNVSPVFHTRNITDNLVPQESQKQKPVFERLDSTGNSVMEEFIEESMLKKFKGCTNTVSNMDEKSRSNSWGGAVQQPNGFGWFNMQCRQRPRIPGAYMMPRAAHGCIRNPNVWTNNLTVPPYPYYGFNMSSNGYYYPYAFNNNFDINGHGRIFPSPNLKNSRKASSFVNKKSKCDTDIGKKSKDFNKMKPNHFQSDSVCDRLCEKMDSMHIASEKSSSSCNVKDMNDIVSGKEPNVYPPENNPGKNLKKSESRGIKKTSSFECFIISDSPDTAKNIDSATVSIQSEVKMSKSDSGITTMKVTVSEPNSASPNYFNVQCSKMATNSNQKVGTPAVQKRKRCRSSKSRRKRQRLKQLGLWNPVDSNIHEAKRVQTSQKKCNGTDSEKSDSASIKSPVAFTFGLDISEKEFCDNMQHVQAQVSFTFDSSDDSDFDTAACDIPADDLWETFKSPMTFNLTCVATAVGVPLDRQKSVSTPVKEANAKWQALLKEEETTPSRDNQSQSKVQYINFIFLACR